MKKKKSKAKGKPAKKKAVKKKAVKKVVRKAAKKKVSKAKKKTGPQPRPGVVAPANSVLIGYVEDFFAKIGVIAFTLTKPLSVGNRIHVLGHTTNFEQNVDSMQIEHQVVTAAKPRDGVGIKVIGRARAGDHVYLLR